MHRSNLLQLLNTYSKRWKDEAETVRRLIDFVEAHPDCFERSLSVGHITGSAWVVNRAGTHVLLTHHKKLDRWLQLGGHADGNSDILDAAQREANEESGLLGLKPISGDVFDIDIHLIPERKTEPAHYHYDIRFVFQTTESDEYVVSDESHDLAWVDIQRLEEFSDEASMLRMAEKWLDR